MLRLLPLRPLLPLLGLLMAAGSEAVEIGEVLERSQQQRLEAGVPADTGSERARRILENWPAYLPRFVKVMPTEYKRALGEMAEEQARRSAAAPAAEVRAND